MYTYIMSAYSPCRPTFPSVVQAAFISSMAHARIKSRIYVGMNFGEKIFLVEKRIPKRH